MDHEHLDPDLCLWRAYIHVLDLGVPLVDDESFPGERFWSMEMKHAMLDLLRVPATDENLFLLDSWLMEKCAKFDLVH